MTTIKVPRELRDRVAKRASLAGTTLAGAIEIALEESDERRFWAAVTAEHAALTAPEREEYARAGGTDDLSDADDKAISERNEW